MHPDVFLRTLRNQRRSLVAWFLCLGGTGALIAASYGQLASSLADYEALLQSYPEEVLAFLGIEAVQMSTPSGFLRAELSSWIPAVLIVFAVLAGARSTAAEEEAGTFDLLLAAPISRTSVMLQKIAALAVSVAFVVGGLWSGVQGVVWATGMDVGWTFIAAEHLQLAAMTLAFSTIALLVGAQTGRRGLSAVVAGVIATASFLLYSLGGIVKGLEPWRRVSLYYYYSDAAPIINGLNVGHLIVLTVCAGVAGAAAIWAFNRRDIAS